MENNRYADESYGYNDGFTLTLDHGITQNDEWSGNKARDGADATANEC